MIFVTVGSQKFQFNRLLKEVDRLVEENKITEEVFAQIGYSDYLPNNYRYKEFLDRDEFANIMRQCDKVITHGGTGAIIAAVKRGKKVIAVPRLKEYGEHIDNHQLQILKQFDDMKIIHACYDVELIKDIYNKIDEEKTVPYISSTQSIMKNIEEFIGN